jgi:hypothetical protein
MAIIFIFFTFYDGLKNYKGAGMTKSGSKILDDWNFILVKYFYQYFVELTIEKVKILSPGTDVNLLSRNFRGYNNIKV